VFWACFRENWVYKFGQMYVKAKEPQINEDDILNPSYDNQEKPFPIKKQPREIDIIFEGP
jgi:hypothetical protein